MTFWQVDEHTLTSRQDCQCCVSVVSLWLCSLPLMGFGDARNVSVGEAKGTCVSIRVTRLEEIGWQQVVDWGFVEACRLSSFLSSLLSALYMNFFFGLWGGGDEAWTLELTRLFPHPAWPITLAFAVSEYDFVWGEWWRTESRPQIDRYWPRSLRSPWRSLKYCWEGVQFELFRIHWKCIKRAQEILKRQVKG